jgi:hypothetical protein
VTVHHVFVSYSRTDAAWVSELTRRVEAAEHTIWLDQRDIPMTLPWFEQIGDAIVAADLFLICDSPASRESANCGTEAELALEASKQGLSVTVGDDPGVAAAAIDRALRELTPQRHVHTELSVAARDWDKGGRRRGALVSSRTRRRLVAGVGPDISLNATERAFLKASKRRSRRRTAISVGVGLTIVVATLVTVIIEAALTKSNQEKDMQAAAYLHTSEALERMGGDPYIGLDQAAVLGRWEGATEANVLEEALSPVVPDDGFRVPSAARRFAISEVGSSVVVAATSGGQWQRAADARDVRSARPTKTMVNTDSIPDRHGLEVRRIDRSGAVAVLHDGTLMRRITFSGQPQVLRFSPDGRELAAAVGDLIEIADLRLGTVRTTAAGARGPIRDLAWSHDGARLWGLTRGLVVSWPIRDGSVLLDQPDEQFEALLPAASGTEAWVIGQDGKMRRFEIGSGQVTARAQIPDTILSGTGAADGSVAALSGERGLWIVPLAHGQPKLMHIPGCTLGRATFMDPSTLYLPCLDGKLLRISVARRKVEQRIFIARVGVFAARALPRSRMLLVSNPLGDLFVVKDGKANEIFRSDCGGSINRIGVSATERVIAPVGSGTGLSGCGRRGILEGSDPTDPSAWRFDAVIDQSTSALAESSAVSADGSIFAYGFSDGTVILHPTTNILPVETITNVDGEVRDMYATAGGALLVATKAGIVQRIPLCRHCLSNRSMAQLARSRLKRGVEIGTAKRLESGGRSNRSS